MEPSPLASKKAYRGLPMEGMLASWYAKNTAKLAADFKACTRRIAAQLAPGARVLEVAPGPGYLAIELAKLGRYRITGVDISRSFVRMATEHAARAAVDAEFRQGNAAALPFADGTFDFIVCRAAFKNFSNPVTALGEMHRVLRPGGKALIIDMRNDASNEAIDSTVEDMRLGRIDAFLTRAIFQAHAAAAGLFQGRFRTHGGRVAVRPRRHRGGCDGVRRLAAQIVRAGSCRCDDLRRSGHAPDRGFAALGDPDGLAAPAPRPVPGVEHAGARRAAVDAAAVGGEIPRREIVPVAADEGGAAAVAIGALARAIVDVAGVDVTQTRLQRDAPRRLQRRRRRRRRVHHLPVRMKGREVQRHVGAETLHHPAALRLDFRGRVVLAGNEQRRDLEPNIGLVFEVFERLEHRVKLARA